MVAAIGSVRCLVVTSCALAPTARPQANASVAIPTVVLIMMVLLVPAIGGLAGNRFAVRERGLLELVLDLVDAGLGTDLILVTARGAGDANGANRFFTDHDRQGAARGGDVGKEELPGHRILPHILGELARGRAERT